MTNYLPPPDPPPTENDVPAWELNEGWGGPDTQDTDIQPDAFTPIENNDESNYNAYWMCSY